MYCTNCGAPVADGGTHCTACGATLQAAEIKNPQTLISAFPKKEAPAASAPVNSAPAYPTAPAPAYKPAAAPVYTSAPAPATTQTVIVPPAQGDDPRSFFAKYPEYRLMSAWSYFGLGILYSLPIIGFIFLIIHSFNGSNLNRRSYARSYWIIWLLAAIGVSICAILALVFGVSVFGLT